MNSTVGLGGIFIVQDATAHASVQIINMGDREYWETHWISITCAQKHLQGAQPVCLLPVSPGFNS